MPVAQVTATQVSVTKKDSMGRVYEVVRQRRCMAAGVSVAAGWGDVINID